MTFFLSLNLSNQALGQSLSPASCVAGNIDCSCYSPEYAKQIADSLDELVSCGIKLEAKEELLKRTIPTATPANLYWQEPSFLIGGIVVSFSVGILIGSLVLHK